MPKPNGYPLPWCEALDAPYWQINMSLCAARPGWAAWQSKLSMAEIIPEIDRILAEASRIQPTDLSEETHSSGAVEKENL